MSYRRVDDLSERTKKQIRWYTIIRYLGFCIISILFLLHLSSLIALNPQGIITSVFLKNDTVILNQSGGENRNKTHRVILLWNSYFSNEYYSLQPGKSYFKKMGCSVSTCEVTIDQGRLPEADAVVFHAFVLKPRPEYLPKRAKPDQVFVFYLFESPLLFNQNEWLRGLVDIFNVTFTYLDSPDTDIVAPHGLITTDSSAKTFRVPETDLAKNKCKHIAWVVSNCQAKSMRWEYVRELRKYIDVDIYGKCSNLTCARGRKCFETLSRDYFFYLAFENSYCDDYVTEKFFRTLGFFMVPVVMGRANYSKYAPKDSFIDVRDFNSPASLATFLTTLSNNISEYMKYFEWRRGKQYISYQTLRLQGFCRLCAILHNDSHRYKSHFDPNVYWNVKTMCLEGTKETMELHLTSGNATKGG